MCRNCSKVANLKRLKLGIVHCIFLSQPSAWTREVLRSKQPPVCRKFSGDDNFELLIDRNFDLPREPFLGKTEGAECTSHSLMHVLAIRWRINSKCVGGICNKENKNIFTTLVLLIIARTNFSVFLFFKYNYFNSVNLILACTFFFSDSARHR